MRKQMDDAYLLLMATTGSIFAALDAGKIPASTPTARHIRMVAMINGIETYTGKLIAVKTIARM